VAGKGFEVDLKFKFFHFDDFGAMGKHPRSGIIIINSGKKLGVAGFCQYHQVLHRV
jgi:hypothetical protein